MSAKLLIASTNRGKREEITALLLPLDLDLVFPDQLDHELEIEETGSTYTENALLKARAYSRDYGLPVMADDTGLEVDWLDGKPGLHSARFILKPGATDADRRSKLVSDLKDKPRPWKAHFACAVAVVLPNGEECLTSGAVYGEIQPEERGEGGFGYDRLFLVSGVGKTMAELSMEEKNTVSHRALAVKAAIPFLIEHLIQRG